MVTAAQPRQPQTEKIHASISRQVGKQLSLSPPSAKYSTIKGTDTDIARTSLINATLSAVATYGAYSAFVKVHLSEMSRKDKFTVSRSVGCLGAGGGHEGSSEVTEVSLHWIVVMLAHLSQLTASHRMAHLKQATFTVRKSYVNKALSDVFMKRLCKKRREENVQMITSFVFGQ